MIELLPVEGSVEGFFALKPQNSGSLDLSGFELEFNSQISSDLLLRAGITISQHIKKIIQLHRKQSSLFLTITEIDLI